MTHTAEDISQYIDSKTNTMDENLRSHIMYIFHGESLATRGKPLFDKHFIASWHGPQMEEAIPEKSNSSSKDLPYEFLDKVWQLHNMDQKSNHQDVVFHKDSPWRLYFDKKCPDEIIPNDEIKDFFVRYPVKKVKHLDSV